MPCFAALRCWRCPLRYAAAYCFSNRNTARNFQIQGAALVILTQAFGEGGASVPGQLLRSGGCIQGRYTTATWLRFCIMRDFDFDSPLRMHTSRL